MFWDFTTWFVIFVRFSAYLLLFPITAAQAIPVIVRLGFAALGAFLILPLVPAISMEGAALHSIIRLFFLEVSTGPACERVADYVRTHLPREMVLDVVVPRTVAGAEAFAAGQPLVLRTPDDPAARAYVTLAARLAARLS